MSRSVQLRLILLVLVIIGTTRATYEARNPNSPLQCYSCQGINCQRTSKVNATATCTDALDTCVTIFTEFAVEAKGCYEDMPVELRSKCDKQNNSECLKCFGQLCNNRGRPDFKCIECDSRTNSKCSTDTTDMSPVQCPIPTALNSYCYVRTSTQTGATTRGCLVHLMEQKDCLSDSSCSMCLSDDAMGCNSYQLDSTENSANKIGVSLGPVLALLLMRIFN